MATTTVPERISRLSTEFVHVKITSDVDYSSDVIMFAVVDKKVEPLSGDWITGEAYTGGARVLIGPDSATGELTVGTKDVWVKITSTPEIPVKFSGQITVF